MDAPDVHIAESRTVHRRPPRATRPTFSDPAVYQEKPFNLKVLRQDVDKYIKSDPEVNKLEQKVTYIETTVNYLERTLKLISNRTFTIKNAVDWKKFTSGVI